MICQLHALPSGMKPPALVGEEACRSKRRSGRSEEDCSCLEVNCDSSFLNPISLPFYWLNYFKSQIIINLENRICASQVSE